MDLEKTKIYTPEELAASLEQDKLALEEEKARTLKKRALELQEEHRLSRQQDLEEARKSAQKRWTQETTPEIRPSEKYKRAQALAAAKEQWQQMQEGSKNIDLTKFWDNLKQETQEAQKRVQSTPLEPRYLKESPVKPSMTAADEAALSKLSKGLSVAGGLAGGALMAKDIAEGNPLEAGITGLETGLGYLGKTTGRVSPVLELLRATPTASEEHEMQEMQKYRRQQAAEEQELSDLNKWGSVDDILSKNKQKSGRMPASE